MQTEVAAFWSWCGVAACEEGSLLLTALLYAAECHLGGKVCSAAVARRRLVCLYTRCWVGCRHIHISDVCGYFFDASTEGMRTSRRAGYLFIYPLDAVVGVIYIISLRPIQSSPDFLRSRFIANISHNILFHAPFLGEVRGKQGPQFDSLPVSYVVNDNYPVPQGFNSTAERYPDSGKHCTRVTPPLLCMVPRCTYA